MAREFKLPDLGEGLKEGTLVTWKVKEGDTVAAEQAVAEVETDKATTELPSPYAGKVLKLHFKPGDVIPVGSVILTVEEAAGATAGPPQKVAGNAKPAAANAKPAPAPAAKPAPTAAKPAAPAPALAPVAKTSAPVAQPAPVPQPAQPQRTLPAAAAVMNPTQILAAPATRKLAREKGVDLKNVRGTGPGGRITQEDVLSFISGGGRPMDDLMAPIGVHGEGGGLTFPRPMLPDFNRFGEHERRPASPVRRRIVQAMTLSSQVTAAVTYMDEADVTALETFRQEAKEITQERGVKLTSLAVVVKACAAALQRFPDFNASYDDDKQEIVYKKYYHVGIAVDSPQGLLVPVLRHADQRPISELAGEIVTLAEAARSGKIQREQMQGGTFTITNIGVIGGLGFTPVINWPEVAILGLGRSQERLAFDKDGKTVVARKMLPLCLTFDHRLIDGAAAARFVNAVKEYLENPLLLLMDA